MNPLDLPSSQVLCGHSGGGGGGGGSGRRRSAGERGVRNADGGGFFFPTGFNLAEAFFDGPVVGKGKEDFNIGIPVAGSRRLRRKERNKLTPQQQQQ